ncbi:MAG TPA: hypothetical protein VGE66_03195 [Chitinophagaceae bacterium]
MNLSIVSFDTILLWVFGVNFLVALILDQSAVGRERFASKEEEQ